ncbi:unnamed protein product, partial [Acanthoscelides obtectus]
RRLVFIRTSPQNHPLLVRFRSGSNSDPAVSGGRWSLTVERGGTTRRFS